MLVGLSVGLSRTLAVVREGERVQQTISEVSVQRLPRGKVTGTADYFRSVCSKTAKREGDRVQPTTLEVSVQRLPRGKVTGYIQLFKKCLFKDCQEGR